MLGSWENPHKCRILKFIVDSFVAISVLPIGDSAWSPVVRSGSNIANNRWGGRGKVQISAVPPLVSLRHSVHAYIQEHFTTWRPRIYPFWSEENTGKQKTVSFKPWKCRGRDTRHKCTGENTACVSGRVVTLKGLVSHTAPVREPQVHLYSLLPT